ncbi:fasciclin domain-containing protein [Rufibacter tibetensis]|uniref:FAS1 domain-containing protein n=1 Tax=Rufibacter tibetensis TaxID=512763 RepID=A0A0P0CQK7_9BACT|nr:fasciclin domain-containing protein [Rufibacter tibetensis]ALI99661.1 hypothetical protein DC20_12615 [Rufibacter tibetensis]
MKKSFFLLTLTGALALGTLTASAQTTTTKTKTTKTKSKTTGTAKKEGVMVGGAMMVPSKNIVANALGSSEHTTLVAAVKAAGLAETLMGTGPFTVFAPTNAAFDKLPAGTVETLLKPENKTKLASVLTYHVVPGRLQAKDLKDGQKLTTVQGETLMVSKKGNMVMINGAQVSTADVISSNGVTHVIDTVVLPTM